MMSCKNSVITADRDLLRVTDIQLTDVTLACRPLDFQDDIVRFSFQNLHVVQKFFRDSHSEMSVDVSCSVSSALRVCDPSFATLLSMTSSNLDHHIHADISLHPLRSDFAIRIASSQIVIVAEALRPFYHFLLDLMDDFTYLLTYIDKSSAHPAEGASQTQDLECAIVFESCEFVIPKNTTKADADVMALQVCVDLGSFSIIFLASAFLTPSLSSHTNCG